MCALGDHAVEDFAQGVFPLAGHGVFGVHEMHDGDGDGKRWR